VQVHNLRDHSGADNADPDPRCARQPARTRLAASDPRSFGALHDDLAAAGRTPATRVLRNEVDHADRAVATALQVPEGTLVISLQRIRFADGEPVALMRNALPAGLLRLSTPMLAEHGLYELLRAAAIRPTSATQRMSARNASATEARLLGESRGAALLTMERIARDETGRPVEFGRHLYRPAAYAFTITMPAGTAGG
jgi:DNA-binding GntR family transcriptional regulator